MDIHQIFATSGALPQKFNFEVDQNIGQFLYIAGSCYTPNGNEKIGVRVIVDGDALDDVWVFANEKNSHKAVVARLLPIKTSLGPHTIELDAIPGTGTISDQNDFWAGYLLEFGDYPQVDWSITGPVPSYTDFQSNIIGPALLFFSASCWMTGQGAGGINVVLDGNPIAQSTLWFNEANSHKALAPLFVPINLTYGPHQIGFSLVNGDESTDGNDVFQLAVLA